MNYIPTYLHDSLSIEKIYTIHYFEYMANFTFDGESHNFWEFIYVDKGEINITAGTKQLTLQKGEIFFHQPNEFHAVQATGLSAPNIIVISFASKSSAMHFFTSRLLTLDTLERNLLASIIKEAEHCFSSRADDPYLTCMVKKNSDMFGAEQMIRLYLEHFLIHIIRRQSRLHALKTSPSPYIKMSVQDINEIFHTTVEYLENHLGSKVSLEQICRDNSIGRTQLQKIFHEKSGCSVIDYFSKLKIDTAKQMLRTNQFNITQISEKLGYTSVHYFSRQFKKATGMPPSEYASSVKALSEGNFK